MLTVEIIQRYYFQKGQVQYMLKDDTDVKVAANLLNDEQKYKNILTPGFVE